MEQDFEEDALQGAVEGVEADMFAVIGYFAHELSTHITQADLIKNCARITNIPEEFVEALLKDCSQEFFKRLTSKT